MLTEALVHRLSPIQGVTAHKISAEPAKVSSYWSYPGHPLSMGRISVGLYKQFTQDGSWIQGPPFNIVLSSVRLPDTLIKHPLLGAAAIVSLLATIDKIAQITPSKLRHIVRSNNNSSPVFKKLARQGIYHLSDFDGNRIRDKEQRKFPGLFAAKLPFDSEFGQLIAPFAIEEIWKRSWIRLEDPMSQY